MPAPGFLIGVGYVLIPWAFVMALGYCCGPVFRWTPAARRRALLWTGVTATLAFVVIRAINGYGDPNHWTAQRSPAFTVLSFLNCSKYPPSLCYLLMTLGPACLALALIESWTSGLGKVWLTLGRVPLFFYVLHLPTIHLTAIVFALVRYGHAGFMFMNPSPNDATPFPAPAGYGYSLCVVYHRVDWDHRRAVPGVPLVLRVQARAPRGVADVRVTRPGRQSPRLVSNHRPASTAANQAAPPAFFRTTPASGGSVSLRDCARPCAGMGSDVTPPWLPTLLPPYTRASLFSSSS